MRKYTKHDWACFHDAVLGSIDIEEDLNIEELKKLYKTVPSHIKHVAMQWGMSDTVFRDEVFTYFRDMKNEVPTPKVESITSGRKPLIECMTGKRGIGVSRIEYLEENQTVCKGGGEHEWLYNFPSIPNKRICGNCKERQKLNLTTLEWTETFEDKRSDEKLIEKWYYD